MSLWPNFDCIFPYASNDLKWQSQHLLIERKAGPGLDNVKQEFLDYHVQPRENLYCIGKVNYPNFKALTNSRYVSMHVCMPNKTPRKMQTRKDPIWEY